jgi:hypothetical protein
LLISYLLLSLIRLLPSATLGGMDDRKRTLAAITVIIGILVIVSIIVGILMSGKKVLSPVPEDNAIKIIFISPTPVPAVSVTPFLSPTPTKKSKP